MLLALATILFSFVGDSGPQSLLPEAPAILPVLVHDTESPPSAQ